MFPSLRLKSLTCPNKRPCPNEFFCFFDHSVSPSVSPSAVSVSTKKRALATSLKESPQIEFKKPEQNHSLENNFIHSSLLKATLPAPPIKKQKTAINTINTDALMNPSAPTIVPSLCSGGKTLGSGWRWT